MDYQTLEYRVYDDGSQAYILNGKLHRENGPAIIREDGSTEYWLNGCLHRLAAPAVVNANGYKAYYLNNKRHCEDGPAVIYPDGSKEYWLDNDQLTEEQFKALRYPCAGKFITVDGIEYILTAP